MTKIWLQQLGACAALSIVACVNEPAVLEVGRTGLDIQGGRLEHYYPAVGMLQSVTSPTDICTGTLISEQLVLTAAHCVQHSGYKFVLQFPSGITREVAVEAKTYEHPLYRADHYDMRIVQLSEPVTDVVPMIVNEGEPPLEGDTCIGVGFGRHLEPDGSTSEGNKRSCTEIVRSADYDNILVDRGNGLVDHGDSGGPLICRGLIAGVVRRHYDASAAEHEAEYYTTVDAAWVQATLNDPTSSDRDPRRLNFDCSDYPPTCVVENGQSGIRECTDWGGLSFYPCDNGCEFDFEEGFELPAPQCAASQDE